MLLDEWEVPGSLAYFVEAQNFSLKLSQQNLSQLFIGRSF